MPGAAFPYVLPRERVLTELAGYNWVEFDPTHPATRAFLERMRAEAMKQLETYLGTGRDFLHLSCVIRLAILEHALTSGVTPTLSGSFETLERSYWSDALGNLHPERRSPVQTCHYLCVELLEAWQWIAWCAKCHASDAPMSPKRPPSDIRRHPAARLARVANRR